MGRVRVFENPDGTLRVTTFASGIPEMPRDDTLSGLPYVDVEMADLPKDGHRAWRLKDGRVIIDRSVSTEPIDRLADLKAQTTVAGLRAALVTLLEGR